MSKTLRSIQIAKDSFGLIWSKVYLAEYTTLICKLERSTGNGAVSWTFASLASRYPCQVCPQQCRRSSPSALSGHCMPTHIELPFKA